MAAMITTSELRQLMAADLDRYAIEHLPEGSLARFAYENKPYPAVRKMHKPSEANPADCEKWSLTPEEWTEEMEAARLAMAHDMKLDLLMNDATPAM